MKDINNKTIWITGASDGIGKELALQLAKKGAKIILTARNQEKLEAVKNSLAGEGHLVYPMDLLKTELIPDAAKEVLGKMGTIDMLINNAGISQRSLAKNTALEVDRKIMELDYFAVISLTKALLPHFLTRKQGHIVTISSVAGKIGPPMRSAYAAAKHAVIGFMDSLRAETHKENLKVLIVTPGSIQTNISKNALEGDGAVHNVTDPAIANGLSVEYCAKRIIRAIEREDAEVLIAGGKEKMVTYLKRLSPSLVYRILRSIKTT